MTSVDHEGTGRGYDLELTRKVSESLSIPLIASGGCGNMEDLKRVVLEGKVDAVLAASVFHYDKLKDLVAHSATKSYQEGNINYVKDYYQGNVSGRRAITPVSVIEAKQYLCDSGIECRI